MGIILLDEVKLLKYQILRNLIAIISILYSGDPYLIHFQAYFVLLEIKNLKKISQIGNVSRSKTDVVLNKFLLKSLKI